MAQILKERNIAVDVLRTVAILAVLMIHTTTRSLEVVNLNINVRTFTLFLNQASRFAVPVFFMISGFLLELNYSGKDFSYPTYFKKRISRIFVPYIFWSFIYYYFVYRTTSMSLFDAILTGNASYQLYFIPALVIFYALFPLIHKYYDLVSNKWVLIFLGACQIFLLNYDYRVSTITFSYPIKVVLLNYFIFLLGVVVARNEKKLFEFLKRWKFLFLIVVFVFAVFVFLEGKTFYLTNYNYLSFYSQWRPSVFFYSLFVFATLYLFLKNTNFRFIKKLSDLSYFVFFIHVIILEIFWKLIESHTKYNLFFTDIIFFSSVTFFSFLVAYLVHKLRFLTKITG